MAQAQQISTWCGRPLVDLSREELIEAVEYLGNAYTRLMEEHRRNIRATTLGKIELWKRGEGA